MLVLFGSTTLLKADELTVYDGTTTNSYVPVYGNWADAYLRCQYVMPAEDLADMTDATINCMKFYLSSTASAAWTGTFQVYMTEVDYTSISGFIDPSTATTVYQGTLDATGTTMTVLFDNEYTYSGGNLLIGFDQIVKGNYKSASFYGVTATGASVQGYNSSALSSVSPTQRNFLPKTTFIYELAGVRYNITLESNPSGVGTLTGAGRYNEGAECTINATCSDAYYFINWTLEDVEVSREPEYTFTVTEDANYVANFGEYTLYQISAIPNNESYGYTTGMGTYYENQECTLTAVCLDDDANYFINWTRNGVEVTTEPVYTFTVTESADFVANFGEHPLYTITVATNPTEEGVVTGAGTYYEDQVCMLNAISTGEYLFVNWTVGNEVVSTNANYSFTVTRDVEVVANFETFDVTTLYNGEILNTETPICLNAQNHYLRSQYVMPAEDLTDLIGKSIKGLKYYINHDELYTYDSKFRVYMREFPTETITQFIDPATAVVVYEGLFSVNANELTISFDTPYDYYGGHLMIGIDDIEPGTSSYAYFYGVDKRDASIYNYSNTPFDYIVNGIQTNFLPKTKLFFDGETAPLYEITASVNPEEAGYVVGAGVYSEGLNCTLKAVRNPGYTFVNWTINGDEVSTEQTYTFQVRGDVDLVANFVDGGSEDLELTVHEGSATHSCVPVYGFYADAYLKCEMIYPAEELVDIIGLDLNKIKFYATQSSVSWDGTEFQVFVTEVEDQTISEFYTGSKTMVYQGALNIVDNEMLVEFETPYNYNGGNLLVAVYNITGGSYAASTWYGETVYDASVQGYSYSSLDAISPTQRNFLPKTTFCASIDYTPAVLVATPDPINLGYRPNGAWMQPFTANIANLGGEAEINDVYVDNDYFQVELNDVTVPFVLPNGERFSFNVNHGEAEEGEVNATMTVYYKNYARHTQFNMSAIAYNPVEGDVWENAIEVAEFPYAGTAPANIHYNYNIPGGNPEANDAVYKVTVDQLSILDVNTGDAESVVAIYPEDFEGVGGPDLDNTYSYNVQMAAQGDEFSVDFEGGIPDGWTQIDADGDGYNWVSSYNAGIYHNAGVNLAGSGHNSSDGYVISGSYTNAGGYALNPDNYFITPKVNIGVNSAFSFWACSQDVNYQSEHFGVGVSTDGVNFTMLREWTIGAKSSTPTRGMAPERGLGKGQTSWINYVVDLSAYAGQNVYIAIRHFNCYDMFLLNVDDVELSCPVRNRDAQSGFVVAPGTYYVVVASTENEFPVNINLSDVPAPIAAQVVNPINGAVNVLYPCQLMWRLGDYTEEMQVLFGTTNPPTEALIDWTDQLVSSTTVAELEHNTVYYLQVNERNYTGTTEGEVITFTSYLDIPELYTDHPYYAYEGEDLPIYWNAIEDETFLSYNVYLNDTVIYNTTDTSFTLVNPAFNLTTGYYLQVSAVYSIGESEKSNGAFFYVSGNGNVAGAVYEQDGVTPVADAYVYFSGTDVFGIPVDYEFTTNEEGAYTGSLPYGQYYGYAYKEEYQVAGHAQFWVVYNQTTEGVDFIMNEIYYPVYEVIAEEVENKVDVTWSMNGDRSLQYFRVYRSDAYSYNNMELIADSVFATAFTDEAWDTLVMGTYKYGVSALYEGNHEGIRIDESNVVDFEEGLPEGWTILDDNADGYTWCLTSEIPNTWTYYASVTLDWYHNGTNAICCGSYINGVGALTPDDYLVSPLTTISNGSTFSFWAAATDASYPAEHFGVFVSSNGIDNWSMLDEWTMTAKSGGVAGGRESRNGNGAKLGTWYNYSVDLSAYAGQQVYIAIRHFNCNDQYILAVDDIECPDFGGGSTPTPAGLHESSITWSNFLSKDMYLGEGGMSVTVTLNSGDSPAGALVTLYNLNDNEQLNYPVEPVVLDETGVYTWDSFRKGEYYMVIEKDGYYDYDEYLYIYSETAVTAEMTEITEMVSAVYVSPTGWAMWDDALDGFTPPTPSQESVYWMEGFNNGIPEGWTVIDSDGDGHNWMLASELMPGSFTAYEGENMILSQSYHMNLGALNPDNYLVTPLQTIGNNSTFSFWAAAQDASYASEHFGVAVSSDGYNFTTISEWTMNAKGSGIPSANTRSGNRTMGNWYQFSVDLSDYAGMDMYIAIRHFNCTDWFYLDVDQVEFSTPAAKGGRHYENYHAVLSNAAGEEIYSVTTTDDQMQLPVEGLTAGETYYFKVANVYSSATTDYAQTEFVYTPCDDYEGYVTVVTTSTEEGNVVEWSDIQLRDVYSLVFNLYDTYGDGWNNGYLTIESSDGFVDYLTLNGGSEGSFEYYFSTQDDVMITYTAGGWPEENWFTLVKDGVTILTVDPGTLYTGWTYMIERFVRTMVMRDGEMVGIINDNYYLDEGEMESHTYSVRRVYPDYAMACEQEAEYRDVYDVTIIATPENGGIVYGSGSFYQGSYLYAEAYAYDGYDFYCWMVDDVIVSYDQYYEFVLEGDIELIAKFVSNTNHWTFDPNAYENSMSVTGIVNVDGEIMSSEFYEVGAFVGDECRGAVRLTYVELDTVSYYMAFMTIYGETGDELTFALYDHYNEEVVDMMCTNEMTFEADATIGTPFEPYVFNFMSVVEREYNFTPGWNWWSTDVELSTFDGLAMLEEGLGSSAAQIASQSAFTKYYPQVQGWYGSLTSLNNESMYRINVNAGEEPEVTMIGAEANPADHPITIKNGWNHIGFVSGISMSVDEAMANLTPSNGDMVKTQKSYSKYYASANAWFGSLNTINPGDGLMYNSKNDENITLVYPSAPTRDMLAENLTGDNNHWVPNVYSYPSNMTVMAVVELDGVEIASDNYELAAFAEGECRGSVRLVYAEPIDRYVAFLTVSGEEFANLNFGIYNVDTDEECFNTTDALNFSVDAMVGDFDAPFVISFSKSSVDDMMVYPNPVSNGERVRIALPNGEKAVSVEIVNSLGKVVVVEDASSMSTGIEVPYAAGVYTIRVITESEGVKCHKLVVK